MGKCHPAPQPQKHQKRPKYPTGAQPELRGRAAWGRASIKMGWGCNGTTRPERQAAVPTAPLLQHGAERSHSGLLHPTRGSGIASSPWVPTGQHHAPTLHEHHTASVATSHPGPPRSPALSAALRYGILKPGAAPAQGGVCPLQGVFGDRETPGGDKAHLQRALCLQASANGAASEQQVTEPRCHPEGRRVPKEQQRPHSPVGTAAWGQHSPLLAAAMALPRSLSFGMTAGLSGGSGPWWGWGGAQHLERGGGSRVRRGAPCLSFPTCPLAMGHRTVDVPLPRWGGGGTPVRAMGVKGPREGIVTPASPALSPTPTPWSPSWSGPWSVGQQWGHRGKGRAANGGEGE